MNTITYTGDGQTSEFNFNAKWFQDADIRVAVDDVMLDASEYSVLPPKPEIKYETPEQAAANNMGGRTRIGGRVRLASAPSDGSQIDITRQVALGRIIRYQKTEPINPNDLNTDLDQIVEYLRDRFEG